MNVVDIKRYIFEYADSNMFIFTSENEALVIDPNISDEALKYLCDNKIVRATIVLTHEHYDHTSGLVWLCEKINSTVICHSETALSLSKGRNSRPVIIASNRMAQMESDEIKNLVHMLPQNYRYDVDITFNDEYVFYWQGHKVRIVSTPGHSKGSCCIEIDDNIVATGDSLILNTPVITRFPGGSQEIFEKITLPYLKKIGENVMILPGHGDMFFMKEARR